MSFPRIRSGESISIDANVFVYSFADDSDLGSACTDLLERVETGDVIGVASSFILSDVAHRLMTIEACETFGWTFTGIGRKLRQNPDRVQALHRYRQAIDDIVAIGVEIMDVGAADVRAAGALSRRHGLLGGDALIVALMQRRGIDLLASNDADFDRVAGITRISPL